MRERLTQARIEAHLRTGLAVWKRLVLLSRAAAEQHAGGGCAIDPGACPVPERHEDLEPAGYSACAPKPSAACTAYYHEFNWYRPGDPTWKLTCLETEAECRKYIDGWKIHIVERDCVSLR